MFKKIIAVWVALSLCVCPVAYGAEIDATQGSATVPSIASTDQSASGDLDVVADSESAEQVAGEAADNGATEDAVEDDAQIASAQAAESDVEADSEAEAEAEAQAVKHAVPAGTYYLASTLRSNFVCDIESGSAKSGANARMYLYNGTAAQQVKVSYDKNGFATLTIVGSGKALDVKSALAAKGTNVQQYESNGTQAQKWVISKNDDGTFTIASALDENYVLDIANGSKTAGANLQLYAANGSAAQSFEFVAVADAEAAFTAAIEDGLYTISDADNATLALDVASASASNGANVQLYTANATAAQKFYIERSGDGFYTITNQNSGKVVEVSSGAKKVNSNIAQYSSNGSAAQKWDVIDNGDGTFTFANRNNGYVLGSATSSPSAGNNVSCVTLGSTSTQRFILTTAVCDQLVPDGTYVIESELDSGKVLDVASASTKNGANVQLYANNNTNAQKFKFTFDAATGYYKITNVATGKVLDVSGGTMKNGANIQQYASNNTLAQRWILKRAEDGFRICSAKDPSYEIDIAGGSKSNGVNVQLYKSNLSKAQRFKLRTSTVTSTANLNGLGAVCTDANGAEHAITGTVTGDAVYLFLPSYADLSQVTLTFGDEGATAEISSDGSAYSTIASGDAIDLTTGKYAKTSNGAYTLYLKSGSKSMLVRVMQSSSVGTMFITSDDAQNKGRSYVESSADHSASAKGSMALIETDGSITYDGALSQIKGRGNSTWNLDKKPYQIKLDKSTSLIDGTKANKAKTWVLLANRADQSGIRNYMALKSAIALGLTETTDCKYVDLYYDGEYRGSYLLCEKVQVNSGRVDITDLDDLNESDDEADVSEHVTAKDKNSYGYEYQYVRGVVAPDDISGGYLMELDNAYSSSERAWFKTSIGTFVLKTPENASHSEVKYISEYVQRAINEASKTKGDIEAYFDLDSLVKTYLVELYSNNADYIRYSSTYFYKDAGSDLLVAGPVWDFDLSFGNYYQGAYTDAQASPAANLAFFRSNAAFKAALKEAYPQYASLFVTDVDGILDDVSASYAMDEVLWSSYYAGNFGMQNKFETKTAALQYLKSWVSQRLVWMNATLLS